MAWDLPEVDLYVINTHQHEGNNKREGGHVVVSLEEGQPQGKDDLHSAEGRNKEHKKDYPGIDLKNIIRQEERDQTAHRGTCQRVKLKQEPNQHSCHRPDSYKETYNKKESAWHLSRKFPINDARHCTEQDPDFKA